MNQFLSYQNIPSLTCAQDRAENSSANERRVMISLLSYCSGVCFASTSINKSNESHTHFGIFLGKFLQLLCSLHHLPHVLDATFAHQLFQRNTCDDRSAEEVLVRCVYDTSFSGADRCIQGLCAYYQYATLEHHKRP